MPKKSSQRKSQKQTLKTRLTLELKALGLAPIQEPDGVVRIGDGPEHVMLLSGGIVGDDASLQLSKLVATSADSDQNGGVLGLEGTVKNLLNAVPAVLERRLDAYGASDSELLHDVSRLQHIGGPLIGFGASFQALYRQNCWGFWVSSGRV